METDRTKRAIIAELSNYPSEIRERPETEAALSAFEREFGPIPPEVRWFLSACGGGVVGSERIDGLADLRESNRKYRMELGPDGWSMTGVFIVGWDGWGNPIAVHRETGKVLIEDHNFGGVYVAGESFSSYVRKLLAK